MGKLNSLKETALKIGVTPKTLYNWIKAEAIDPPKIINKRPYFTEEMIDKIIK